MFFGIALASWHRAPIPTLYNFHFAYMNVRHKHNTTGTRISDNTVLHATSSLKQNFTYGFWSKVTLNCPTSWPVYTCALVIAARVEMSWASFLAKHYYVTTARVPCNRRTQTFLSNWYSRITGCDPSFLRVCNPMERLVSSSSLSISMKGENQWGGFSRNGGSLTSFFLIGNV